MHVSELRNLTAKLDWFVLKLDRASIWNLLSKYTQSVYISKCIDYAKDGLMKKYVFGKVGVHEVWTVEPPFTD